MTGFRPQYIGDGVYVSTDGYHIWLRTGSRDNPEGIALEPSVLKSLVRYAQGLQKNPVSQEEIERAITKRKARDPAD